MKFFGGMSLALLVPSIAFAATPLFIGGNIVVSVSGNGGGAGVFTDNQASPLTLQQYARNGTSSVSYVNSLVLPQIASGANFAISAEYGSSSEGLLQRSGDGRSLVIMGYGVNADAFNANPTAYGTTTTDPTKPTALAQSGSLTGQSYTAVARVVANIGVDGSVDTSTALYNIYNGNNPRSAFTIDGSSFYTSGQGVSGDKTGGIFYATDGAHSATSISGLDTSGKTATQDTRDVQVYNGQLYVSVDSKQGTGSNRDFVGTLGTGTPTTLANNNGGPTSLKGFGNSGGTGKLVVTLNTANGIDAVGQEINLSPEQYFFANASTLYVADSGMPKNDSALNDSNGSGLGNGGLQKWVLSGNTWNLAYTLSAGLGLVANTSASGVTGLFGLAGLVTGNSVELYATSSVIGDTDQTYLYGITDSLAATAKPAAESFTTLAAAGPDSKFMGVAFAPVDATSSVPEPETYGLMILGFGVIGGLSRAKRSRAAWFGS
ncbi:PEP-CTERM sorting domain-containing protein [Sphingomonas bacterium]|uniref:PEP-CTERM sorting domain-containing protein n=1 Tax=Sphingomonas bacterium TaxID=1895847 RepID=UPI001C2CDD86|nr:PEP-CTERM sorting domain-containing protein [Sphingomonas bacterium]